MIENTFKLVDIKEFYKPFVLTNKNHPIYTGIIINPETKDEYNVTHIEKMSYYSNNVYISIYMTNNDDDDDDDDINIDIKKLNDFKLFCIKYLNYDGDISLTSYRS